SSQAPMFSAFASSLRVEPEEVLIHHVRAQKNRLASVSLSGPPERITTAYGPSAQAPMVSAFASSLRVEPEEVLIHHVRAQKNRLASVSLSGPPERITAAYGPSSQAPMFSAFASSLRVEPEEVLIHHVRAQKNRLASVSLSGPPERIRTSDL